MMEIRGELQGYQQIRRALNELPGNIAGQALRRALNISAREVRDPARKELRSRGYSARTWRAVVVRNQRNPDARTVMVWVSYLKDSYWLIFQELGAEPHEISIKSSAQVLGFQAKSGNWVTYGQEVSQHPGVSMNPWLRPAFDNNKQNVIDRFAKEIWPQIVRSAERLNQRSRSRGR